MKSCNDHFKRTKHTAITIFLAILSLIACSTGAELTVNDLRCEYLENPLGIDTPEPRLSWIVSGTERGAAQSAYQILVAESPEVLAKGQGTLWDSGKVAAKQTVHIAYAGKALNSRQRCYWKVRVWDTADQASAWSPVNLWSMGLLAPEDWKGIWIGLDETEKAADTILTKTQWIWYPEKDGYMSAPAETRLFRRIITLPEGKTIAKAKAYFAADNRFGLYINGESVASGSNYNSALPVDITTALLPGKNCLAVRALNAGEVPNPAGLLGIVHIEFMDGEVMEISTDTQWRTAMKAKSSWKDLEFDDSAWASAAIVVPYGGQPWGEVASNDATVLPARYLRRDFTVDNAVTQATASICGLGLFELELNGEKVGNDVLVPALTEYDKRALYLTYDVTEMLRAGANAIGVTLGNGRYYAPRGKVPTSTRTYGYPKLIFDLHLEYADGSTETIISDTTWQLNTEGPIRANNEYDGEFYDAQQELTGWSAPGYDAAAWQTPQAVDGPAGKLAAHMLPPIRVIETLQPKSMREVKPGVFVYDMGQNLVGWCRMKVQGPAGTMVKLRHAETIQDDGMLYMANLRSAECLDTYMLKGDGEECYEPRFTYHGFRYVEITGYPGVPTLDTLEGCVVHDDLEIAGEFSTSNPLLNQIYENIVWGVRGNYRSFPTDCPQRDERQAWLGDRSAECLGESYMYNIAPLYAKWLWDIEDSQKESGSVSDVSPSYWPLYNDNVTWPSTFIIAPGMLLDQYEDRHAVAAHYPAMKRWITHMTGYIEEDGLIHRDSYGDWCVPPESPELIHSQDPARKTSKPLLSSSYFYHDLRLMARYARLLGNANDAEAFEQQAESMKTAFNTHLLDPKGQHYDNSTQTSCVLPLAMGLAPEASRGPIFAHLVDNIVNVTDRHIGTGLIGGQWLMRTLTEHGELDLAYTIATQKEYPSWGYMVESGATTIWELWNGDTADPAMNSGNHVMLVGDLVIWFYEYLGGIRRAADSPGFQEVVIKPYLPGGLDSVDTAVRTTYGRIASQWQRTAEGVTFNITIPANVQATISLPADDNATVLEGDRMVWQQQQGRPGNGIETIRREGDRIHFSVGSGVYAFHVH